MPKRRKKQEEKEIKIEEGDLFGLILRMLGGSWIEVYCSDEQIRKVRIPRSKRYIRVRENDVIIIRPWYGIDESRADLKDKLMPRDIRSLLQTEHAESLKKILTEELKEIYGIE
ncbi:MAG: hypothetical protein Q6363_002695 [Candidatus Njordarchaeota archaeon]